jgi:transposase InsO family protein
MSRLADYRTLHRRPAYPALIRGDDGGLHVRSFATSEDAGAASRANPSLDHEPYAAPAGRDPWKHTGSPAELSRRLNGVPSADTITRLCREGGLPCRDMGTGRTLPRYRLPIRAILASIAARGLRATVAAHRAGQLFV